MVDGGKSYLKGGAKDVRNFIPLYETVEKEHKSNLDIWESDCNEKRDREDTLE